ncbi:myoglobin-like [Culicoides brevitarsis]|uniref:myoglobin-like n=1 Tax=Culicoides brevitarsis TaxID=469753 RepID=UPI00307B692B
MPVELTDAQKNAIIQSWTIPAMNPIDAGEIIFYKFFEKYPHNHQMFQKFKNTPLHELKGTPVFRHHASIVINTFSSTVDCLLLKGGWEHIPEIWKNIAADHNTRNISKKSFVELRDIVVQVLKEVCHLKPEQEEAWTILLDYVYESLLSTLKLEA